MLRTSLVRSQVIFPFGFPFSRSSLTTQPRKISIASAFVIVHPIHRLLRVLAGEKNSGQKPAHSGQSAFTHTSSLPSHHRHGLICSFIGSNLLYLDPVNLSHLLLFVHKNAVCGPASVALCVLHDGLTVLFIDEVGPVRKLPLDAYTLRF